MENETSKTRSLKTAFLLEGTSFKSLQTLLSEMQDHPVVQDRPVEYRVKFSDGSTVKYCHVKEIIGQPNAGAKCIIGVITRIEGNGRSLSSTMRGDPEPSVEYTLTGAQRDVGYFADKLDVWIASCTQWYSPFYTSSLGVLLAIALCALPIYLADRVRHAFSPNGSDWHSYLPGVTLVIAVVVEYWTLKLFPRATFAVVYGARRDQLFSVIRVSVLLAIAVALLWDRLMRHI
jgi:hypothetical protein